MKIHLLISGLILMNLLTACAPLKILSGEQDIRVNGTPPKQRVQTFDHQPFVELLNTYVDADGRVRYQAWFDNSDAISRLDDYLVLVSTYSPDSDPELFPGPTERLAYWVNAYNAWVIKAILLNWPLESVNDVKARMEIVRGFGFFYSQQIQVGGEKTNLYSLEKDKILKRIEEPRIHFLLNCGSESCPPLRPIAPASADMENTLRTATTEFFSHPRSLSIEHAQQQIRLSEIIKWYKEDFVAGANALGLTYATQDQAVIRYLGAITPTQLSKQLRQADNYKVVWFDYDWSINQSELEETAQDPAESQP